MLPLVPDKRNTKFWAEACPRFLDHFAVGRQGTHREEIGLVSSLSVRVEIEVELMVDHLGSWMKICDKFIVFEKFFG